jgi:hypothetical protein
VKQQSLNSRTKHPLSRENDKHNLQNKSKLSLQFKKPAADKHRKAQRKEAVQREMMPVSVS